MVCALERGVDKDRRYGMGGTSQPDASRRPRGKAETAAACVANGTNCVALLASPEGSTSGVFMLAS